MMKPWRKRILFPGLVLFIFFLLSSPAWAEEGLPQKGKPLTLDQCTAMALKYHPSLRASLATVDASKAKVEQALAAYYPQLNLTNTYNNAPSNYFAPFA